MGVVQGSQSSHRGSIPVLVSHDYHSTYTSIKLTQTFVDLLGFRLCIARIVDPAWRSSDSLDHIWSRSSRSGICEHQSSAPLLSDLPHHALSHAPPVIPSLQYPKCSFHRKMAMARGEEQGKGGLGRRIRIQPKLVLHHGRSSLLMRISPFYLFPLYSLFKLAPSYSHMRSCPSPSRPPVTLSAAVPLCQSFTIR